MADNTEEFQPLSLSDIEAIAADVDAAAATGLRGDRQFRRHGVRGYRAGAGAVSEGPAGIRDIAEWYMSTRSAASMIHGIFARQCEVALANLARIHARIGDAVDAVFLCGTDFGTQTSAFCSVPAFRELWLPYYREVNDWVHAHTAWKCFKHSCGSVERFYPWLHRGRLRHHQPGAMLGGGHGAGGVEAQIRRRGWCSGAAAWTPRRRCRSARPQRSARAGAAALRDFRAGRWFRLQLDSQYPGGNAGGKYRRPCWMRCMNSTEGRKSSWWI